MQRQDSVHLPAARDGGRGEGRVGRGHAMDQQAEWGKGGGGVGLEVFGDKGVEVVF